MEFALSSITPVTANELRSICANIQIDGKNYLAAGDRVNCLHTFVWNEESKRYDRVNSFSAHSNAISAIAFLKPCEWVPEGGLVTSSRDNLICVWPNTIFLTRLPSETPTYTLVGHENNVCFVTTLDDGTIISSSWDGSARVWKEGKEVVKMQQEKGIWGVVPVPLGYATLGADKTIRIYDHEGKQLSCLEDAHTDVVRAGFFKQDTQTLVTTANDGTIREWFIEPSGELSSVDMITVTDTYLYSIILYDKYYICGSEDKCAYIVDSESKTVHDVLPVPGVAWGVTNSPNGICITATDGHVYSFTDKPELRADKKVEKTYIAKCAGLTFNNPQFDQINILDLAKFENVASAEIVPGRFELMREGEEMILVVHNLTYGWMKVGTLTKSKGSQAQKYTGPDGKEYDFCFSVQIDELGATFPLYLNYDTNPYMAASKFIQEHHLQIHWLDTIANFIIRNLKGQKIEMSNKELPKSEKEAPKSNFFPIKEPNYISSFKPEPIIKKLKAAVNEDNTLTDEDAEILAAPLSPEWVDVATRVLLLWEPNDSWPLLDILRAYILDDNAKELMSDDFISTIVEHFASNAETLADFGVMGLMRVIGNLGLNYSSMALNQLNIPDIFSAFISRIHTLPKISQIPFSNAIMNFTCYGLTTPAVAETIVEVLYKALSGPLDDEAQYRALLAYGNAAQLSTAARKKILNHPEILDNGEMSDRCKMISEEIIKVIQ